MIIKQLILTDTLVLYSAVANTSNQHSLVKALTAMQPQYIYPFLPTRDEVSATDIDTRASVSSPSPRRAIGELSAISRALPFR